MYVGVIGRKVAPQFADPRQQGCVRVAFRGERLKSCKKLLVPMRIGTLASDRLLKRANYFYRGVQNDHPASCNSRIIWAALRFARIGFADCVRFNHSCMVGRSAVRSNSRFIKSERLMPSRAARAFNVLCTRSGTFLTWIIFDMCDQHTNPRSACPPKCDSRSRRMRRIHSTVAGLGRNRWNQQPARTPSSKIQSKRLFRPVR